MSQCQSAQVVVMFVAAAASTFCWLDGWRLRFSSSLSLDFRPHGNMGSSKRRKKAEYTHLLVIAIVQ